MKRAIALLVLIPLLATATQVVDPPVTAETLVGTWEALPEQHPPLLWHMEIKEKGDSYLAQAIVGGGCCTPQRLLSSVVSGGKVKLHFASAVVKELRDVTLPDIWIIGSGVSTKERGVIEWKNCDDPSCAGKPGIYFIKGTWTRDVAEASKMVEKAIREQATTR